jgi:hypothetical protein
MEVIVKILELGIGNDYRNLLLYIKVQEYIHNGGRKSPFIRIFIYEKNHNPYLTTEGCSKIRGVSDNLLLSFAAIGASSPHYFLATLSYLVRERNGE